MQRTKKPDYVNELPRDGQTGHTDTPQRERKLIQLLVYSFGVLCIVQAILNVSLRLFFHSKMEVTQSDCNTTHYSDKNQMDTSGNYDGLMQRILALTRDRKLLENRNTELINMIKMGEEEREKLKMQLSELNGCEASQQCPTGWRMINSRCYFLSSESKTWEESRRYCQSRGADLVVINSEQEQKALYHQYEEAVLLFWIGLRDIEGTFKWVDGSALTKSFWQTGQPNPNDNEDCVEMYHFYSELANWNDTPCGKQQRWLCEKDLCTSS
ncbi:CD209 antigen-like protein C [Anabas testudineus]|uniref:CD209 antigen-like protein C n=1 Tax=Anabas testudineus TaxID=64144 RepID=UPI000E4539FB|nr:CD209 antigen-like protein C [Anabas testudineus]